MESQPLQAASLDDLVANMTAKTVLTGEVDVSDLFPDKEGNPLPQGSVVFVYEDPTVEHFFAASKDGTELRKKFPHWTIDQATNVALLAICHKAPVAEGKRGLLYAKLVQNTTLFMRLNEGFNTAFPHLKDIQKAAEEQEKSLSAL